MNMLPGRRGLLAVRADASGVVEIRGLIDQLNRTHADFRAENDRRLKEVEARGSADPLTVEKVETLNAAIAQIQSALDDQTRRVAALTLAGAPAETPEAREHRDAFRAFVRHGVGAVAPGQPIQNRGSSFSDPDGGFRAPSTVEQTITRVLAQTVAMRGLAQTRTFGGSSYVKYKSLGGAGSGWVGESDTGAARPETNTPQLARMDFVPGEVYAEPATTNVLLDDADYDVEGWYADEVATEFVEREGAAFISGDGVKKPRGFLSYDTVLNASYAWGRIGYVATGGASGFAAANPADAFLDTIYALKAGYRNNASWLMSDLTAATVRKFKDGQGNYLWQPTVAAGQPSTFMGYPVATDDNMPAVAANAFPVAFADWRQAYLIADRTGTRVMRNPYKVNGLVFFYTTRRVGGGVQNFEAIKLLRCEA